VHSCHWQAYELTIRVALDDHHASQLANAQLCDFFAFGGAFYSFQDATLYYAVDALIQQGHGGGFADDLGQWWKELLDQPWLERGQCRKLSQSAILGSESFFATYELDELDGHPVVVAFDQQVKQARRKRQEVLWSPPSQFAHDVYDGGRHTGILLVVLQTLLDLGPRGAQCLWIHEGKSVEGHDRLLADHGVRVCQARYQIGEDRVRHARIDDMRYGAQRQSNVRRCRAHDVLLELVLCQHQDLCVSAEALDGSKVSRALLLELGARHDFEDVEARPRHVVPEHLEVGELHEGRGLQVHVVGPYLLATFSDALGNVLFLRALVVAQASDEVVEGFLEPGPALATHRVCVEGGRGVHVGELRGSRAVVCLGSRAHVEGSWCAGVESSSHASLGAQRHEAGGPRGGSREQPFTRSLGAGSAVRAVRAVLVSVYEGVSPTTLPGANVNVNVELQLVQQGVSTQL
jgi:hypothetical protein